MNSGVFHVILVAKAHTFLQLLGDIGTLVLSRLHVTLVAQIDRKYRCINKLRLLPEGFCLKKDKPIVGLCKCGNHLESQSAARS